MKYFQNVVDIVRDLMSPTGVEKNYKQVSSYSGVRGGVRGGETKAREWVRRGGGGYEAGTRVHPKQGSMAADSHVLHWQGMRKDDDGFTDILWCKHEVCNTPRPIALFVFLPPAQKPTPPGGGRGHVSWVRVRGGSWVRVRGGSWVRVRVGVVGTGRGRGRGCG